MPLIDGLTAILEPGTVERVSADGAVDLWEETRDFKMCVTVTGLPAVSAKIRMESGHHASKVRDGKCKWICDYLLVAESGDRTDAVLVELKKTRTDEHKPREQLRRSLPVLEYLRSVCKVDSETSLQGPLHVHYWILFKQTSERLAKQGVRIKPGAARESYKSIEVRTFVGERVSLAVMTGE